MARWGLCSGCVLGILAIGAVGAAMRWPDGAAGWIGWGVFAVFGWGAVMSVYYFDRPAPYRREPHGSAIDTSKTQSPRRRGVEE